MASIKYPGEIKVVDCGIVKKKIEIFYCKDCFFFGKEFCKQYQMEVSEDDGCSNYELIRGFGDGK